MTKPASRPNSAHFSSGPCAKRPGWTPELLKNALVGRSHRSKEGKQRLVDVIEQHLEDLHDIALAEAAMERIKNGERTYTWEEMERELGLED